MVQHRDTRDLDRFGPPRIESNNPTSCMLVLPMIVAMVLRLDLLGVVLEGSLPRLIYPGDRVTCRVLVGYNDIPKLEQNLSVSLFKQSFPRSVVDIPWSPSYELPSTLSASVSLAVIWFF